MVKTLKMHILFARGIRQINSQNYNNALISLQKALELSNNDSRILLHLGRAYAGLDQKNEAVNAFLTAIRFSPKNPAIYLLSGIVYFDWNDFEKALEHFDTAFSLAPENPVNMCFRHLALCMLEKPAEDTFVILEREIRNANSDLHARFLVYCEKYLGDHSEHAHSLDGQFFHSSYITEPKETGRIFVNTMKQHWTAFRELFIRSMLILSPARYQARVHYHEGDLLLSTGRVKEAVEAYQKALENNPGFEHAMEKLIDGCIYLKDYKSLTQHLQGFEEFRNIENRLSENNLRTEKGNLHPQISSGLFFLSTLGHILHYQGNSARALELFEIVSTCTDDFYPLYYSGLCALSQNATDKALHFFKRSVEALHPDIVHKRLEELIRVKRIVKAP